MPRRRLDEEFDREELRRDVPELKSRRRKVKRIEEADVRECAREGVRHDAREDSRAS